MPSRRKAAARPKGKPGDPPAPPAPLPGINVALDCYYDNLGRLPFADDRDGRASGIALPPPSRRFPSAAIIDEWKSNTLTVRELAMLAFINDITDKPDWNVKIHDEAIVAKWRAEAVDGGDEGGEDEDNGDGEHEEEQHGEEDEHEEHGEDDEHAGHAGGEHGEDDEDNGDDEDEDIPVGFSDQMFDFAMAELRDKAAIYEKYNGIVSALDAAAMVVKQDVLAEDAELLAALKAAVAPLEDVPDEEKDWHPGSNGLVLDLVHPSLWPLVYGKTRVLRDKTIGVDDCLASIGGGEVIPVPELREALAPEEEPEGAPSTAPWNYYSKKFQWLPADVKVEEGKAKITSYINNLHPVEHAPVYTVVERLIEKALPLLEATYDRVMAWNTATSERVDQWDTTDNKNWLADRVRIRCDGDVRRCTVPEECGDTQCCRENRPAYVQLRESEADYDEDAEADENESWYRSTHPPVQPEPAEYKYLGPRAFNTSGPWFGGKNLQVIVKFANIHLTPENPHYGGGTWHVEGQVNERICASALFYYDSENVSDSHLFFRTMCDVEQMGINFEYDQDHRDGEPFGYYFGKDPYDYHFSTPVDQGHTAVDQGYVLTREGRLLVFPNVYQHCVGTFDLVDETKPGHRKIVALFLVDPETPVVSTAHVPPQQKHWAQGDPLAARLPTEVVGMVREHLECPYGFAEAAELREELMAERGAGDDEVNKVMTRRGFYFCEH